MSFLLNIITTDLVGDANDVANKLSDRIFKALDAGDQVSLCMDLLPEHLELTHLQQISEVEQSFHLDDEQLSREDRNE